MSNSFRSQHIISVVNCLSAYRSWAVYLGGGRGGGGMDSSWWKWTVHRQFMVGWTVHGGVDNSGEGEDSSLGELG